MHRSCLFIKCKQKRKTHEMWTWPNDFELSLSINTVLKIFGLFFLLDIFNLTKMKWLRWWKEKKKKHFSQRQRFVTSSTRLDGSCINSVRTTIWNSGVSRFIIWCAAVTWWALALTVEMETFTNHLKQEFEMYVYSNSLPWIALNFSVEKLACPRN